MDALRVGVLDQRRLAGLRVDGEDREAVLAIAVGAIDAVDAAAVGMHVDRATELARAHPVGFLEKILDV